MTDVIITREEIESRAVTMTKALAVTDEAVGVVWRDNEKALLMMQGMRLGAMAAIDLIESHRNGGEGK